MLKRLLTKNKDNRISAAEALQHEAFNLIRQDHQDIPEEDEGTDIDGNDNNAMNNLKDFHEK